MAIRKIVTEGDPILNQVCRPVTSFDDRLAQLLDDMKETLALSGGVGLAGPQVGIRRRLFICEDMRGVSDAEYESPNYQHKYIEFVNPEIVEVSEETNMKYEGCLSFPGHNGAIRRPNWVKARAQDRNGEWFEIEAEDKAESDLLARCICHENNHLDGVTIMELGEFFYEDQEQDEE